MSHPSRAMHHTPRSASNIGLDLGDRKSRVCELDADGHVVLEAEIATTPAGLTRQFGDRPRCRVVLETGGHSPWVSRLLTALGHEAIVANPAAMYGSRRQRGRRRRNDRLDAEFLARQGRSDITLLHPITHRSATTQQHLELVRARNQVVETRTKLINHVRGAVKALGSRLPACSAEAFPARAGGALPEGSTTALQPMLTLITTLTQQIRAYDDELEALAAREYPVVERLRGPAGVGLVTALTYVLVIADANRFKKSRTVGAYLGLVPQLDDSSDAQPQLRITKAGDQLLRRLLVSAAQYILGPFGPDCDLRRHGDGIARRGGKNAKKRAVVAVARKLAVLLHRLWVSDQPYDPHYVQHHRAA
jgi:Transposase and inactivated derivatives